MHRHGKGQDTALGLRSDAIGTFFKECLRTLRELDDVDLFVSKAASEVVLLRTALGRRRRELHG